MVDDGHKELVLEKVLIRTKSGLLWLLNTAIQADMGRGGAVNFLIRINGCRHDSWTDYKILFSKKPSTQ